MRRRELSGARGVRFVPDGPQAWPADRRLGRSAWIEILALLQDLARG